MSKNASDSESPPSVPGATGRFSWLILKPWQAYLFAAGVTFATLGVRMATNDALGGQTSLLIFILPIILSAYATGWAPSATSSARCSSRRQRPSSIRPTAAPC